MRRKQGNNFSRDTILEVAAVMARSFLDDPLNQWNLAGVKKKEELLYQHSILHVRYAVKTGTLQLLDNNPKAFLIGVDSVKINSLSESLFNLSLALKTLFILDAADRKAILANYRKTKKVIDFTWQDSFIKGRFYRVKIIAIDKEMHGTGAFRRLISPRIEYSDQYRLPMVLETHNPKNVGMYHHFGFELVKTISSDKIEIEQFCMIRQPG